MTCCSHKTNEKNAGRKANEVNDEVVPHDHHGGDQLDAKSGPTNPRRSRNESTSTGKNAGAGTEERARRDPEAL